MNDESEPNASVQPATAAAKLASETARGVSAGMFGELAGADGVGS